MALLLAGRHQVDLPLVEVDQRDDAVVLAVARTLEIGSTVDAEWKCHRLFLLLRDLLKHLPGIRGRCHRLLHSHPWLLLHLQQRVHEDLAFPKLLLPNSYIYQG